MSCAAVDAPWQEVGSLADCVRRLYTHKHNADVTFHVRYTPPPGAAQGQSEPVSLAAHRTVLACRSHAFSRMFYGDLPGAGEGDTVTVEDVEPEAFNEMLRFIYTDEAQLTPENVLYVLHAAKKYLLPLLASQCVDFLQGHLDAASTACAILDHGLFFDEPDMAQKALKVIQNKSVEAFESEAFCAMSAAGLSRILDSSGLSCSELQLFEACVKWAEAACARTGLDHTKGENLRKVLGDEMLFKIRVPTIGSQDFSAKVVPRKILTDQECVSVSQIISVPGAQGDIMPFSSVPRARIDEKLLFPNVKSCYDIPVYYYVVDGDTARFEFLCSTNKTTKLASIYIFELPEHKVECDLIVVQNNRVLFKCTNMSISDKVPLKCPNCEKQCHEVTLGDGCVVTQGQFTMLLKLRRLSPFHDNPQANKIGYRFCGAIREGQEELEYRGNDSEIEINVDISTRRHVPLYCFKSQQVLDREITSK